MAKHTLIAYVEDVPGVLNRIASLFRRRNFNIDSLTVGRTEQPGVSRLTVVVEATDHGAQEVPAVARIPHPDFGQHPRDSGAAGAPPRGIVPVEADRHAIDQHIGKLLDDLIEQINVQSRAA